MGVSDTLAKEVKGIAVMVMIIVVFSIVLVKFKEVDGTTTAVNSSIDNAVSYLQEPVGWISIVIIIIVVAWLMKYLKGKKGGM